VVWQWQRGRSDRRRSGDGGIADDLPAPRTGTDPTAHSPLSDPGFVAGLRPIPSGLPGDGNLYPVVDIAGTDPSGRPVRIAIDSFAEPLLLAFLHINCHGCHDFWQGFGDDRTELPVSVSAVVVTKGPETVSPGDVRRAAVGIGRVPIVMSDEAWTDYRVMSYPFFVLIEPKVRAVVGETVGFGWADVVSMIRSSRP